MTIDSLETISLTCIFVAPGFLIDGIVNKFSPHGKRKEYVYLLYCIIYSVVHVAIFSWAYIFIWEKLNSKLTQLLLSMSILTFIGAIILGIVIGLIKSKGYIRKFANKITLNISHSVPTAWDYFFSQQKSCFLIVTLIDDHKVYGWFGRNSFASSDSDERDIYIEKIYMFENNQWIETQNSLGIYINYSQIKTIEFIEGEYANDTKKQ